MDKSLLFRKKVSEAAGAFAKVSRREHIRLVSHYDSDGLCSSSIMIKALGRLRMKYSVSVVQMLNERILKELAEEEHRYYVFTDLGSGCISKISENFKGKTVFILDHHFPEKAEEAGNVYHINPHSFGINGSKEISGAGVVFLFARELSKDNSGLAHLAVIGGLGDIQEGDDGFTGMNREILEIAVKNKLIAVRKELKVFGRETRPLVRLLEQSNDPFIPGVTGSEKGAINFLKELEISPREGSRWKMLKDLNESEERAMMKAIIKTRLKENLVGDIYGKSYILVKEKAGSPFRDAREFSTLLNACGRMSRASVGIGACLGSEKDRENSVKILKRYRKELSGILAWYNGAKKSGDIIARPGFMIANAGENVSASLIGTFSSIIAKSGEYGDGTLILSLARMLDRKNTKVSIRSAGSCQKPDLNSALKRMIESVGGESGGHVDAAGGTIPSSKEKKFIENACKHLESMSLEENVF